MYWQIFTNSQNEIALRWSALSETTNNLFDRISVARGQIPCSEFIPLNIKINVWKVRLIFYTIIMLCKSY